MALFSISANDLDAAGCAVAGELPVAWLEEELADATLTALAPGHLEARLSLSGSSDVVVRGRVKAELVTPCARCLAPTAVPVDTKITLFLRPAPKAAVAQAHKRSKAGADKPEKPDGKKPARPGKHEEIEYEFTSDEADQDLFDGDTVVLDPFIREAILLEVPNFPLCSEACPGIGPAAVTPVESPPAVDPRLAPLGALRARLQSQSKKNKE